MSSQPGFEPGTFGLEVQRAIHCATGTLTLTWQAKHGETIKVTIIKRLKVKFRLGSGDQLYHHLPILGQSLLV